MHLVDIIPAQSISEERTCSEFPTKKISLESTSSIDEALDFYDVLLDLCSTQEPETVAEELLTVAEISEIASEEPVLGSQLEIHIKTSEREVDAPALFKYEEPTTADAEQTLTEDKELIIMVEMIISDEEEQLVTNRLESISVEPREGSSDAGFVKAMVEDEQPVDATEEPLLVAEEIVAIVQKILQITEDQVLSIAHEQNGEESIRHVNEVEESEVSEGPALKSSFSDASEALEMLSESAVVIDDQMTRVEAILPCNGTAAVDEESWVIIEEPAPVYTYISHPGTVKEESPTSPSNAEEERDDLAKSTKLLAHLRSVCVEAFEDSSYKPVRVDVRGYQRTISITIEVCPKDQDEFGNTDENNFTHKIGKNVSHISRIDACI